MQLLRTLLLLAITIALVAFIAINWQTVPLNMWPLENGNYIHFEWPVGFIVILSMLVGFLPMWLVHKGVRWQFKRRINFLENSVKSASQTVATTTPPLETATSQDPLAPPQ